MSLDNSMMDGVRDYLNPEGGYLPVEFGSHTEAVQYFLSYSHEIQKEVEHIRKNTLSSGSDLNETEKLLREADQLYQGTRISALEGVVRDYRSMLGIKFGKGFHEEMARQLFGKDGE